MAMSACVFIYKSINKNSTYIKVLCCSICIMYILYRLDNTVYARLFLFYLIEKINKPHIGFLIKLYFIRIECRYIRCIKLN